MTIETSLIPQLLLNLAVILGAAAYSRRALRTKKNRCLTVALFGAAVVGLILNLNGYALTGPVQGGGVHRA